MIEVWGVGFLGAHSEYIPHIWNKKRCACVCQFVPFSSISRVPWRSERRAIVTKKATTVALRFSGSDKFRSGSPRRYAPMRPGSLAARW